MMNLVGQIAIVAAIDLGCAEQLVAAMGARDQAALPVFVAIALSHGALNLVSVRLVARLNDLSVLVHVVGVVVLVGLLLLFGRVHPVAYVFETGFTTRKDGSVALGFLSSLLLGMWTFTGFDASAHVSEETYDPARRAPWGIVLSVIVSALVGYGLVVAITLAIVDLPATAADAHPALFVMQRALGAGCGSAALGLAIVAMWFCGLSAVTSLSRTIFAFARDGGLPRSDALRRVSKTYRTPHIAIFVSALSALVLGLSSAFLGDGFLAVASLATTALSVSYGVPIALGAVARHGRRWTTMGPWSLGRAGTPIAWAAVLWVLVVLGIAALPHDGAYLGLLAVVSALLALIYRFRIRGRFKGPTAPLPR
jgi:amino acid transporter